MSKRATHDSYSNEENGTCVLVAVLKANVSFGAAVEGASEAADDVGDMTATHQNTTQTINDDTKCKN